MGPKLAEFLLEGDRGGRPAVPGTGAIFYLGYQTREGTENSTSNRCYGNWRGESDAGSHRPRTFPLSCEFAVGRWQFTVGGQPLAVVGSQHLVVLRGPAT